MLTTEQIPVSIAAQGASRNTRLLYKTPDEIRRDMLIEVNLAWRARGYQDLDNFEITVPPQQYVLLSKTDVIETLQKLVQKLGGKNASLAMDRALVYGGTGGTDRMVIKTGDYIAYVDGI